MDITTIDTFSFTRGLTTHTMSNHSSTHTIRVPFLPSNSKTIVNMIPNTVSSIPLCFHIYSMFIKTIFLKSSNHLIK